MKITIIQPEIEEAMRNHVRSIIAVKEGHDIHMTFSATRGEDGLTAFIDIVPSTSQVQAPAQVQAAPAAPAPAPAPAVEPTPEPAAAPAPRARATRGAGPKLDPVPVEEVPMVEGPAPVEEPPFDTEIEAQAPAPAKSIFSSTAGIDEADEVEEDPEAVEGERPLRKSIFSGLSRPSNGAADPESAAA